MNIVALTRSSWLTAVAWSVSAAAHAVALGGLRSVPISLVDNRPPAAVDFTVTAPPPALPEPEPEPEPEPARVAALPPPTPPSEPEPEPEATAAPVDMTGVTLTNGSGDGWASAVGNGRAMDAPIRAPRRPAAGTSEPRTEQQATSAPRRPVSQNAPDLVAVADLSRKPRPPALEGLLDSNYPPEARRAGLSGEATVIARIDPDGRVRQVSLASETGAGFGAACRNAVTGSLWSPPLGPSGRPVATRVYYTCRFKVDR